MSGMEIIENVGTDAVRRLRSAKLNAGKPFMINSKDLPSQQSYMEFPDNTVKIVSVAANGQSFVTVVELSLEEANAVRSKYNLIKSVA